MKNFIAAVFASVMICGCGAAAVSQTQVADPDSIKALQMQEKSNAERIAKLEKDLADLKNNMDTGQRLTRQLGENYDTVIKMFNDYKTMINKMMVIMGQPAPKQDDKTK